MTRHLLAALLLSQIARAEACPICQGAGLPTVAEHLHAAQQIVLALPTADSSHFRVVQVIKGERPSSDTIEGGYPRAGAVSGDGSPTEVRPLVLVRDDPFPSWVILGTIEAAQSDWLRTLASGKKTADLRPEEWPARFALVIPHLDDAQPLPANIAYAQLASAPYAALRMAKPYLDPAALRRCLRDPELMARQPVRLLLLGISGNAQDAATLERSLDVAWHSGDATNLSAMLTADLELRGPSGMAWVDSKYLVDQKRTPAEIKATLLSLSVHGGAAGVIPRERVIHSYRLFIEEHPEIAGYVAVDLATWGYWDLAPEYVAMLKSKVRQQYPSRVAILAYLRQCPRPEAQAYKQPPTPLDDTEHRGGPTPQTRVATP